MKYSSLYIHVPFCAQRCDFCAFYLVEKSNSSLRKAYLSRLKDTFQHQETECEKLRTIYIGGGTPTFLSMSELKEFMQSISTYFSFTSDREITIEATPDTLTSEKIQLLIDYGVTRFSLGVQSFSEKLRARIGRPGMTKRVFQVIDLLHHYGVENINVDLIYAISGQTMSEWKADLKTICTLDLPHVSTYALGIEPHTVLFQKQFPAVLEDTAVNMWLYAIEFLQSSSLLTLYEVSNFAKKGFQCQHNIAAWKGHPFLGIGPAASYFDGSSRWTNPAIIQWLHGQSPYEDSLPGKRRATEIFIVGLRMVEGWSRDEFHQRTSWDFFDLHGTTIKNFLDSNHMIYEKNCLRLTRKGLLVADAIASEFIEL